MRAHGHQHGQDHETEAERLAAEKMVAEKKAAAAARQQTARCVSHP